MTLRWLKGLFRVEEEPGAGPDSGGHSVPCQPRVLVVDDSAVARHALLQLLDGEGFEVTTAESAQEALDVVARNEPAIFDVILMDLNLPDGTGIDACARIKQRDGWRDVPVIVVTSSDNDHDLTLAFSAGAADYITKPPRDVELLARVRAAHRLKQEMTRRKVRERELEALNECLKEQTSELASTREALVTLNQDLEQRVQAQVNESTSRAQEIDALNAELRVQVQKRSHELAQALRRLSSRERRSPTAAPGAVLGGRVRLVRRLAKGGMGVIYAGVDLVTGSPVAVKLLDSSLHVSETQLQRFIAEASAAAAIAHPAIVTIRHVDISAHGDPFLVMELVEGITLQKLLARGTLSPVWCVSIGHVVADALAAAHTANVIHRDIKPANLMLTRRTPGVRVLDFGISKLRATADQVTLTETRGLLGTPAYMAPEQIQDAAMVTSATDVYSLGTVMFQLMTNALPVRADDLRTRLLHAFDRPARLADRAPDAPLQLANAVDRCLSRDPADRPSARDLADELGALAISLHAPPPQDLLRAVHITPRENTTAGARR